MFLFVSCELTAPTSFYSRRKIYWHLVWTVSMMDDLLLDGRSPITEAWHASSLASFTSFIDVHVTADCLTLVWVSGLFAASFALGFG